MRRRIIKQGANTATVTLPSKWVQDHKILPGTEVDMFVEGNKLHIVPDSKTEERKITVVVSELPQTMVWRAISSAYRAGYNEIRVNFKNTKAKELYSAFTYNTIFSGKNMGELSQAEIIQALVNRFIGVEIIDQGNDYCVLKELNEISLKEFEQTLRRVFLLLISMADNVQKALKGEREGLRSIHMIDTNIDRFIDYCFRVLNTKGYTEYAKTKVMYSILFLLELVGDEYKRLAVYLLDTQKKIDTTAITQINNKLRMFYELFYNYNENLIKRFYGEPEIICSEKKTEAILGNINRDLSSLVELCLDMHYVE